MNSKAEVWQGTLALMVPKTLHAMGPQHGYGIARRIEQTSGDLLSINHGASRRSIVKPEQGELIWLESWVCYTPEVPRRGAIPWSGSAPNREVMISVTEKAYKRGTHRSREPRETLARLKPMLPRMGITRLANVTGLDSIGIPVVMSVRPNSQSLSVSQGKGLDLDSAMVSAAMESVEGFHAESIELPLRLAGYQQLSSSQRVVDVARLPLSDHRHFTDTLPLLWIEGDDWQSNQRTWVPYQLVHTSYTLRMQWDLCGFRATSTGLASGNHLLEAASHAICEAIERDCMASLLGSSDEERAARRIDLNTITDPDCCFILDRFRRAGVDVLLWNITNQAGIAAVECRIVEGENQPHRLLAASGGAGCHPCPEVAVLRALTEAAQSRLTVIAGSRDDVTRSSYIDLRDPAGQQYWRDLAQCGGTVPFQSLPRFESDSFEQDVAWELECLRRVGCNEVVVVDLTKPEFGLSVVRVVIPGMHDESYQQNQGRSPESLL